MISWKKDTIQQEEGGGLVRARAEESSRLCIQCGRAWSARQDDPEGWCSSCRKDKPEDANRNDIATARHIGLLVRLALPEKLHSMAAGGHVKETNGLDHPIPTDLHNQHDRRSREGIHPRMVTREEH